MIINSLLESFTSLSRFLNKEPKIRKKVLIYSSIVLFVGVTLFILNHFYLNDFESINFMSAIIAGSSTTFIVAVFRSYLYEKDDTLQHLERLFNERNELNEKIKEESNVMDVIRINLNQLDEYFTINKVQAKNSYSFSVTMIVIGFGVIITGVLLWHYGKLTLNVMVISTLAGVIAEFIGATSLLMYKESTKQIQLFFDKLTYLQHVMLAIELAEKLPDNSKTEQISSIITSLIGLEK